MLTEYKTTFVEIKYIAASKTLKCVWLTTPSSQELREAMEYELDLAKKNKANRLFFDPTHLGAISVDDQKWLNEYFIGSIIESQGSVKIANLVPENIFTSLSLDEVLTSLPTLSAQFFDNETKALAWLAE